MPQYFTDKVLAARYQVSRATIWRWAKEQKNSFPQPVKIMGSTRWRSIDLEQWESRNLVGV